MLCRVDSRCFRAVNLSLAQWLVMTWKFVGSGASVADGWCNKHSNAAVSFL